MTIYDHGTWSPYTPDFYPLDSRPGDRFCRSDASGVDWYVYVQSRSLSDESVKLVCFDLKGRWIVKIATVIGGRIFPQGARLLELYDGGLDDPTTTYVGKMYDPSSNTLVDVVPTATELTAYAADARYRKEVAGVAWDDYIIQTDRESQSKMLAEFVAISAGLRADPSPWKFAGNKFAVLSNADMAAVCLAGRAHVAAAFAAEQAVQDEIAATPPTITTFAEIDAAFA